MTVPFRLTAVLCLLLTPLCLPAQDADQKPPAEPVSMRQLAEQADAVVLAQMRDADYFYRRQFPVRGSAYLHVLIPYKPGSEADLIEVYERGLHEHECYFPNPTVFEEGRRYLLFLRNDPDKEGRYRGLPQGCAIEVLVTASNQYAVRIPVTGIDVTDPLVELSKPMEFADAYAYETDETLSPADRDAWLAAGWLEPVGDRYVYTRGVDLTRVRELMGPAALGLED